MATGHSAPTSERSRIATTMGKARILMEAMPYIQEFKGKTVVIKYGGSAMVDDELRHSFAGDVTLLAEVGINPVVVHGGGPQISRAMEEGGLVATWKEGLRVTDSATLRVVQRVLAGEVNPDIVRLLAGHNARAVGLTGIDGGLFTARQRDAALGFVGEVEAVDPSPVLTLIERGFVPVVAPLARGKDGATYNLNADAAAGVLAEGLRAEKLVYLTDVEGLYRDLGDEGSLVSRTTPGELRELIAAGRVSAGMLPKLQSCIAALEAGVHRAHILDGRVQHALLLEIFTPEGIGTMVHREAT